MVILGPGNSDHRMQSAQPVRLDPLFSCYQFLSAVLAGGEDGKVEYWFNSAGDKLHWKISQTLC